MTDSPREICERFGYPDELRTVLERIRGLALECYPNLRSLLLSGSITTGDFVFTRGPEGLRLLSDIDAFLFVDGRAAPSEAFRSGLAALEHEHASRLFHVDVSVAAAKRLRAIPRTYQMVETGMAGLVLAGEDVRPGFPRSFDPRGAIGVLLFNLWKGWLYWSSPSEDWDPIYAQVLARLVLDLPLLAFARRGECIPGHLGRARAFLELPDAEPLSCPETRAAVELAARARSGDAVAPRELELRLLPALDHVLDALDGAGPFARDPDAALVRRIARLLPRRTLRRVGGEARALLRRTTAPLRDLAWLLRRKEAAATAAVLGLLPWAFEGARGKPPAGVPLRLAEFTNATPPCTEGMRFVADGRRQYWAAVCRLYPSLREKEGFYDALLGAADAGLR